jgi:hypothetical protein
MIWKSLEGQQVVIGHSLRVKSCKKNLIKGKVVASSPKIRKRGKTITSYPLKEVTWKV